MMKDLHIHTTFCDGENSPEEMVVAAIRRNMDCIGFSAHSYTFFDESYCMKKEAYDSYKAEIAALKQKYGDKIKILCGIEQDFYSDMPTSGFDYVIGSVHYLKVGNDYFSIDDAADILKDAAQKYYSGDFYALCEDYYSTAAKIVQKTGADIIGHFDVISKFNEQGGFFDEKNERYITAYKAAIDKLAAMGAAFEINTGAISRGYKSAAYPSGDILSYLAEKNCKVILSSDSHSTASLCSHFDEYIKKAKDIGLEIL
ncbi:MAG: histidinol-phosphatase [Clostridia bacterium]|nr:histidinol-phosphatase [Clostridia bacterium]